MALTEKSAAEQHAWAHQRSLNEEVTFTWFSAKYPDGQDLTGRIVQKTGTARDAGLIIAVKDGDRQQQMAFPPPDVKIASMRVSNTGDWERFFEQSRQTGVPFDAWEVLTWGPYLDTDPATTANERDHRLTSLDHALRFFFSSMVKPASTRHTPGADDAHHRANEQILMILLLARKAHELGTPAWRSDRVFLSMVDHTLSILAVQWVQKHKGSVQWLTRKFDQLPSLRGAISENVVIALGKKPGEMDGK
eukprot:PhM_4_TR14151/c3_g2_i4/m.51589